MGRDGLSCSNGQCVSPDTMPSPDPTPEGGGSSGSGAGGSSGSSGAGASSGTGASGGTVGAGTSCDDLPACEFACQEGMINPVDDDGCTHTCECVFPGTPAGSLRFFQTCGDPVCGGHRADSGLSPCSSEVAGATCGVEGGLCDLQDMCNRDRVDLYGYTSWWSRPFRFRPVRSRP